MSIWSAPDSNHKGNLSKRTLTRVAKLIGCFYLHNLEYRSSRLAI